jgi:hypothetical protein
MGCEIARQGINRFGCQIDHRTCIAKFKADEITGSNLARGLRDIQTPFSRLPTEIDKLNRFTV